MGQCHGASPWDRHRCRPPRPAHGTRAVRRVPAGHGRLRDHHVRPRRPRRCNRRAGQEVGRGYGGDRRVLPRGNRSSRGSPRGGGMTEREDGLRGAIITGWGKCVPPAVLTNADLETVADTNDEWITTRTGIKERRISHAEVADLSAVAAQHALAAAGLAATDLDLILLATCTADRAVPSAATMVQAKIGATK